MRLSKQFGRQAGNHQTTEIIKNDQILPETRWVAILVIPFLVVAFVILYIFPEDTEKLFAWKIQPPMSAMMLGAAYAGGIYFFSRLLMSREWHKVKVGFPPVITFASLLGIATLLHWDKFTHNHISFYAWAGLYFTTPFIVLIVWLRNRTKDPLTPATNETLLPKTIRNVFGIVGGLTLAIALLLFLRPDWMILVWPWSLTPLTARVVGAMFALPGLVGLGIAMDQRWSSARIILQSQSASILLILIAAVLNWSAFDTLKPSTWLFVGGLAILLLLILIVYAVFDKRASQSTFA